MYNRYIICTPFRLLLQPVYFFNSSEKPEYIKNFSFTFWSRLLLLRKHVTRFIYYYYFLFITPLSPFSRLKLRENNDTEIII